MVITRPILRYPGGKFIIARWIIAHFPQHASYVELFGGAASVLMQKPRSAGEVYNDLDSAVVNVFRVLRDPEQAARLVQLLYLTPYSYSEYKAAYEPCDNPVEQARQTIYRSFAGIGSDSVHKNNGFRGTKNNYGVTAAPEFAKYPAAIPAFVERLQGVVIEQRDALRLIKIYDSPNTLFYADPPYMHSTRTSDSVRYQHEMNDDDHVALASALKAVRGMAVISGYRSDLYDTLYAGWTRVERSGKAQNGKHRVECLWMSQNIRTTLF